jgi:hypothetical protein
LKYLGFIYSEKCMYGIVAMSFWLINHGWFTVWCGANGGFIMVELYLFKSNQT